MSDENIDTISRVTHMFGVTFRDKETEELRQGDLFGGDVIMRFKNGLLHGDDIPAVEYNDGHMEYFRHGVLHRDGNRPAIIDVSGKKKLYEFWNNGEFIKSGGRVL